MLPALQLALSLIPDREERSLREQLATLAYQCQFDEWHAARLVFADWLADRGRVEEEAAVRADWRVLKSSVKWCLRFQVLIKFTQRVKVYGRFNEQWLLGFRPWTLRCGGYSAAAVDGLVLSGDVQFTWQPNRPKLATSTQQQRGDVTRKSPHGFMGLWYRPAKENHT